MVPYCFPPPHAYRLMLLKHAHFYSALFFTETSSCPARRTAAVKVHCASGGLRKILAMFVDFPRGRVRFWGEKRREGAIIWLGARRRNKAGHLVRQNEICRCISPTWNLFKWESVVVGVFLWRRQHCVKLLFWRANPRLSHWRDHAWKHAEL